LAEAVEQSAAPIAVRAPLARLIETHAGLAVRLEEDDGLARALVAVLAASRSLTRLCETNPRSVDVLADLGDRPPVDARSATALVAWKRLELLRIAARDLIGLDDLEAVVAGLADLADDVLRGAVDLAEVPRDDSLAVIGMGKLGGQELNYASDIDMVFVDGDGGSGQRAARNVMEVARGCFRVDVDLRPEGRDGPLVRSLRSYQAYWKRWAQAWERQALLKARPVAGDRALGDAFRREAEFELWGRTFGADDLRDIRAMKARAEEQVARQGLSHREIKRGWGGIRDVEFAVQILQLVHGRSDAALRSRSTLAALTELGAAGYVDGVDARAMADAYRYLRTVEHRLQLVDEAQVHSVPSEPAARAQLARVLGHRDDASGTALARFDRELSDHQAVARSIHERLFFRPLLEAFSAVSEPPPAASGGRPGRTAASGGRPELVPPAPLRSDDAVRSRLAAFGFTDAERTRAALAELTRGLTRSSRLMQQMLPLLLTWLSESPDPDLGLLGLRALATGAHRRDRLVATFRDSPESARRLCLLIGTGRLLLEPIRRNPELAAVLGDDAALARRNRAQLADLAGAVLGWRQDHERWRAGLLRLKDTEMARIAARDVLGIDDDEATAAAISDLAEVTLEEALASLDPPVPMAIVAMGRFGGAELSYASDLDVLIVFDGRTTTQVAAAEEAAEALILTVNGTTPAGRLFTLDTDLRPEGRDGPLARSIDGYRTYYGRWARTWERQALIRARPVAGDPDVARRFMAVVNDFVWQRPLDDEGRREIRRMKARVERERLPAGEDPQFHLKLGRGSLSDIEWTAQLLQLRHQIASPGTISALGALVESGVLDPADAEVLSVAYRFCERTRNRLYLVRGAPGDALPTQADQLSRLARSVGTSAVALREEYRRVTRRARLVVERLFYGIDERVR
jgi:glutamate-ammonia-ligase adenylyltransferase